jgi:hypothetical protein
VTSVILPTATLTVVLALGATLGAQTSSDPVKSPGSHPFMIEGPFGPEGVGRVVTGKPYSAQTVTEMTQTLADGNRIVQRTEGAVYRDAEGRTRREHTFTGMGPLPLGAAIRGRQVGERVYRLTSIARGEPSPQLFVVPADFTTLDARERPMRAKRVP